MGCSFVQGGSLSIVYGVADPPVPKGISSTIGSALFFSELFWPGVLVQASEDDAKAVKKYRRVTSRNDRNIAWEIDLGITITELRS